MTAQTYDRTHQDVGNIVMLEHLNLFVPDFSMATLFYVNAMGFTRDPYIDLGPELIWINLGRQQIHLPLGNPQTIRGTTEVVVPRLAALKQRLDAVAHRLSGTQFAFDVSDDAIEVSGPWGNRFRCRESSPGASMRLGLRAVNFSVAEGAAAGIGRFYQHVIGADAVVETDSCAITVGPGQTIRFEETADSIDDYDGHHLAVYVADFSRPHAWLLERGLIVEETNDYQYRFNWIVDPDSGEPLFEIEHEVRSLTHMLYQRPLINRNADQNLISYTPGADPFTP